MIITGLHEVWVLSLTIRSPIMTWISPIWSIIMCSYLNKRISTLWLKPTSRKTTMCSSLWSHRIRTIIPIKKDRTTSSIWKISGVISRSKITIRKMFNKSSKSSSRNNNSRFRSLENMKMIISLVWWETSRNCWTIHK